MNTIRIILCLAFIAIGALLVRRLQKTLRLTASTMACPNCGSQDVRIENRVDSISSTGGAAVQRSLLLPNHRVTLQGQSGTTINRSRFAKCQKCGFDYPYWTADEIQSLKRRTKIKTVLLLIPLCVLTLMLIVAILRPEQHTDSKSVWSAEYTPLDDFKYYVDNINTITLTDYKGGSTKINIAPSYMVDGKKMYVVSLDSTFALDRITSAIIPETVTRISDNAFNSCGIKYLYLPASVKDFSGWSYFHDGEKLYYGGSEQQWQSFFNAKRSDLDFKQIICNANVGELIASDKAG